MLTVEILLLVYFTYISLYSFVLAAAALLYTPARVPNATVHTRFAVLIPAYKEDSVIIDVAAHALNQTYPADRYDIIVIADSLQPDTLSALRGLPIELVEVKFEKSTKVKALNAAMQSLGDNYDCAVILDADNVMEADFLRKMNNLVCAGYHAVQARRDPKNENTPMALLDGISETINNFIFRQGTVAIGMSSSLNGSGMCFHYATYKNIMKEMESIGGFDRELELKLIAAGVKVHYAKDIILYDEKVPNTEIFERQRRRWISSQFFYLKKYFLAGFGALFKGNLTFFNSAVLRNVQLPRLLNLGLLTLISVLVFPLRQPLTIPPSVWWILLAMNILAMMAAVPLRFYNARLLRSVLLLPAIFFRMVILMFRLRGANKSFIHTPHGHIKAQPTNAEEL